MIVDGVCSKEELDIGLIIGLTVGSVIIALICVGVIIFVIKKKKQTGAVLCTDNVEFLKSMENINLVSSLNNGDVPLLDKDKKLKPIVYTQKEHNPNFSGD